MTVARPTVAGEGKHKLFSTRSEGVLCLDNFLVRKRRKNGILAVVKRS